MTEHTLIIYGSLAPNAPNHSKIAHIKGRWEKGTIKGVLSEKGWGADLGFFGLLLSSDEVTKKIPVYVLFSDELPDNYTFLDEFEGEGYKRVLYDYELENGAKGVGNIYAIDE